MSGNIEDVGARLVLRNREAFRAGLREAKTLTKDFSATAVAANRDIAASTKKAADAQATLLGATRETAAARKELADASVAYTAALAEGDKAAIAAAKERLTLTRATAVAAANAETAARANVRAATAETALLAKNSAARKAASDAQLVTLGKLNTVANRTLAGLGAAGAVVAFEGSKAFLSYGQAIEALHTQAGLAQPRVDKLSKALLKLTGPTATNPTDLANIAYRVASSTSGLGYSDAQLLAMTKAAAQLAVIGGPGTDPEQTARIIGGIKATGVKGAGNPQNIVSLANATVGSGDLRMQDFVDFVGTGVLSSANLAGVSLPEVAGALAMMGDNLMAGNVTGHSLAHALTLLAAPSHIGLQAYGAIGLGGTEIGDLMRTKGLSAAMTDFMQHLRAPINAGDPTVAKWFAKFAGMTPQQIAQAGRTGLTPTEQNMVLTRAFGGAKQAIPIQTLLTQLPRYNAKVAESAKLTKDFGDTWSSTMKIPANQVKQLEAEAETLGVQVGSKVVPDLLDLAHGIQASFGWLEAHPGVTRTLEGIGMELGGLLVATKVAKGITSLASGWGAMKRVMSGSSIASASGQLGARGLAGAASAAAVAIGTFEASRNAGSAGGSAITTLGGAITGMTLGLAIGGPWGAAVGGAVGLISGLAGAFAGARDRTNEATQALGNYMKQAYQADQFKLGEQSKQAINNYLQANPQASAIFAGAGVTVDQIIAGLRSGKSIGGAAGLQLQKMYQAGQLTASDFQKGVAALDQLQQAFSGVVTAEDNLAITNGQVSQHMQDQAAALQGLWNSVSRGIVAPPVVSGGSIAGQLGQMLTGKAPSVAAPAPGPPGASVFSGGMGRPRALGGPVLPGVAYRVGEHHAEWFIPTVPGVIHPNITLPGSAGRGGDGAAVVLLAPGAVVVHESNDPRRTTAAVRKGLADALARQ